MQDVDLLIKIIIPVILLFFWVMSNLFNKESKLNAAKERTAAPAARPQGYPPTRPLERRPPPATQYVGPNEEVMVIRAEPNRPPGRGRPQPQRRNANNKSRGNIAAPARRPEPPPSRNRDLVGGNVATDLSQSLTQSFEMGSLTDSMRSGPTAVAPPSVDISATIPAASALDIRAALLDPVRIREAFLLNEVLLPPVSQRARHR